ncbi:protein kinase [Massilia sp. H-1]|nr:protein kinase [Massilia sp. H-1]
MRAERHRETFDVGLKSFINEARFLAQFDHPSLVKVYRFWEQNHTAYTAMQYYEGRTIKDIVNGSPHVVNEAWCRKILKQILDALEMLYTMRILHRDVSPDNIIVQESGDAVLLDFGSARQIIGDRTRGLTVILKPGYAPVEQYARRRLARPGRLHRHLRAVGGGVFRDLQGAMQPPRSRAWSRTRCCRWPNAASKATAANSCPPSTRAWRCWRRTVRKRSMPSANCSASLPRACRARPGGATQRFAAINQTPPLPCPATNTVTGPERERKRSSSGSRSGSSSRSSSSSGSSSRSGSGSGSAGAATATLEKPVTRKVAAMQARACTHRRRAGCRTWRWAWPWWSFLASA